MSIRRPAAVRAHDAQPHQHPVAFRHHVLDRQRHVGDAGQQRFGELLHPLRPPHLEGQAGVVAAELGRDMGGPPGFIGAEEGRKIVAAELLVAVEVGHGGGPHT